MKKIDTKKLEEYLARAGRVAIIGHFNPDGDCIGSVCAMYRYLRKRGIEAQAVLPGGIPHTLRFLNPSGAGRIICYNSADRRAEEAIAAADLIICLDLNTISRTEALAGPIISSPAPKILIDHHIEVQDDSFCLRYTDTNVSSACELLFEILMNLPDIGGNVKRLTLKCAEALYLGMMTDTNNFANSVFPGTFEMASVLAERGVDRGRLYERVMQSYKPGRVQLMGHLLKDNLRLLPQRKAAYMLLSAREKEYYRIKPGDTEGYVNIPLSIGNVQLSALFTEDDSRKFIRVSLRSKGKLNVSIFSNRHFNGGGHRNAAGGRLFMPLAEVPAYFEAALEDFLASMK